MDGSDDGGDREQVLPNKSDDLDLLVLSSLGLTRRDLLAMGPSSALSLWSCHVANSNGISDTVNTEEEDAVARRQSLYRNDATSTTTEIIPFSSVRSMKTITLPNNGLNVLLVSDKYIARAQCALTVQEAGQFCDPDDLPGCAHLMEHMILSYNSSSKSSTYSITARRRRDFEDWLADREGASNAFTANQKTCFHFSCPKTFLPESLERFASLFVQENVESVCRDATILRREIRRVDAELDFSNVNTQVQYVAKGFVNLEHPYSRFSKGNLESLETTPQRLDVDVGERLVQFFKRFYLPHQAILVVVGPQDLASLGRWAIPFGDTLSRSRKREISRPYFPGHFLRGNRYKQVILYRKSNDFMSDESEKLIFEWVMTQDYRDVARDAKRFITAPQIVFVLSQILERRGPGSFFAFLLRRGWILNSAQSGPRLSIPVDTSGFQILKLEINLTLDGFLNRSSVVMALFDAIETVRVGDYFVIARELIAQYGTIGKLFGYTLAPRPPDAIELAIDAQVYGLNVVASGRWYRLPTAEDLYGLGINFLRRAVSSTLKMMCDPQNSLIIVTAGDKAIATANKALLSDSIPSLTSSKWLNEPVSGARLYFEDMMQVKSKVELIVLSRIVNRNELTPPTYNSLVPTVLRQARSESFTEMYSPALGSNMSISNNFGEWRLLMANGQGLPLPRGPPEPSCRCTFVLQILSPRPARANIRQAARAELWKLSFEYAVKDLAELGAPGGLAYDISFNKFGLRFSFLGISQILPSYARRLTRRLARHQDFLLNGPKLLPVVVTSAAISAATATSGISSGRRRGAISSIRSSMASDVSSEGLAFLNSCFGAVCFSNGDLLQNETMELMVDLRSILQSSLGNATLTAAIPTIEDLVYKPVWKPRYASACSIAGVPLISDACGRIPR